MEPANLIRSLAIVCALIAIGPAFLLERRRKRLGIGIKPYTWAYFQGVASILFGSILLLACIVGGEPAVVVIGLVLFAAYSVTGLFVVRRRRWAWVVLTILELNPISWIINYIYGRNRWSELAGSTDLSTVVPTAAVLVDSGPMPLVRGSDNPVGGPGPNNLQSLDEIVSAGHHADRGQMHRVELLEQLAALHRTGALSDGEFQDQKRRLLDDQA